MPTIDIMVDDELVEIEAGPEDLLMYAQRAFDAQLQTKAWQRQAAIAKSVIDQLQPDKKAVYETDFGPVIANRYSGGTTSTVEVKTLVADYELTVTELRRLLDTATINAKAWEKDETPLGELVRAHTTRKQRAGYINISVGTKPAPSV